MTKHRKHSINASSIAMMVLSFVALVLFALNLWFSMTDQPIDFHGEYGATTIVVFLFLGLLVQIAKMIQGHKRGIELGMTVFLILLHVLADMVIWIGTQVLGLMLPIELPYIIIAVYVVMGVLEVMTMTLPREIDMVRGNIPDPQEQLWRAEHMMQEAQRISAKRAMEAEILSEAVKSLSKKGRADLRRSLNTKGIPYVIPEDEDEEDDLTGSFFRAGSGN